MFEQGKWLSITEYSRLRGVSISSIRRYIKSSKVKHKLEDGKYFIYMSDSLLEAIKKFSEESDLPLKEENKRLREEMRILKEELIDLKMLISAYESTSFTGSEQLPELPI